MHAQMFDGSIGELHARMHSASRRALMQDTAYPSTCPSTQQMADKGLYMHACHASYNHAGTECNQP